MIFKIFDSDYCFEYKNKTLKVECLICVYKFIHTTINFQEGCGFIDCCYPTESSLILVILM